MIDRELILVSIDFHRRIYLANKLRRSHIADRAAHETECNAKQCHIAEIECGLQHAAHARLCEEVVHRVEIDVQRGGCAGEE